MPIFYLPLNKKILFIKAIIQQNYSQMPVYGMIIA